MCLYSYARIESSLWFIRADRDIVQVYANDLNPRSYHYLQENSKLNKVSKNTENISSTDELG